jgi:hypothetical protein
VDLVILGTLVAGTLVLIVATRGRLGYVDRGDPTKTRGRWIGSQRERERVEEAA